MIRRDDTRRDKGDGIAEETNDGLINGDDEVDGQAKTKDRQPFRSSKAPGKKEPRRYSKNAYSSTRSNN